MQCLYCGADVPQQAGKRKREYCNNVCKQQAYRKRQHGQSIQQSELVILPVQAVQVVQDTEELVRLRALVEEQASEISRLYRALDVERRYLADVRQYSLKAVLKAIQVKTPLIEKLLSEKFLKPRDTRVHYEYHLKRLKYSDEELDEFRRLWKLMLLDS